MFYKSSLQDFIYSFMSSANSDSFTLFFFNKDPLNFFLSVFYGQDFQYYV